MSCIKIQSINGKEYLTELYPTQMWRVDELSTFFIKKDNKISIANYLNMNVLRTKGNSWIRVKNFDGKYSSWYEVRFLDHKKKYEHWNTYILKQLMGQPICRLNTAIQITHTDFRMKSAQRRRGQIKMSRLYLNALNVYKASELKDQLSGLM